MCINEILRLFFVVNGVAGSYPTFPWSFGVLLPEGLEPLVQNLTGVLDDRKAKEAVS